MRKNIKLLSALLALMMVLGTCQGLLTLTVFADPTEATGATDVATEPTTEPSEPATGEEPSTGDGTEEGGESGEEEEKVDYTNSKYTFATPEDKLLHVIAGLAQYDENGKSIDASLKNISVSKNGYTISADAHSGEIIWRNDKTGELLLSNPYDVAYSTSATMVEERYKLLSQVLISYDDAGTLTDMNSYEEAALRGQITLKYITNGIRVDYAMGEQESRKLVPRVIRKDRFEELIYNKVTDEKSLNRLSAYYVLIDLDDPNLTEAQRIHYKSVYPICQQMAVYVVDSEASNRELRNIQTIVAATGYSYDDLNEDHSITDYQGSDAAPPLFRFGIEYTLADDGSLSVRLAANSLRYDEDNYKLKTISLLPYFGASNNMFGGYTFIPDGSGALIENDGSTEYTLAGKVFGIDNAYHQVIGQNQQVMRLPVFGVTQFTNAIEEIDPESIFVPTAERETDKYGNLLPYIANPAQNTAVPQQTHGYLAVIEGGDSLARIVSAHGGGTRSYSSVYTEFTPRASDTYDLRNTLSVSGNTSHTVESKRKFTGSYSLRYYMLTDADAAAEAGVDEYYEVSYNGMAKAYQDYLVGNGTITKLENVSEDLPLYIESLGAIDTEGSVLGIPVSEKTPLTTFDDLKTMYEALSAEGINNVNFRLVGFTNGGMKCTYPTKVKFVKELGGDKGFTEFLSYAKDKGIGVYPDFDFSYVVKTAAFDGFSAKKHAVRTIDDRYISQREYDPTWQMFRKSNNIVVSPASIAELYDDFAEAYGKFEATGVSVGSLGSDLNSDFDRDDPYDRNDSQMYVTSVLSQLSEAYDGVMIDGGNAFAIKYADHILNMSFDSSRFAKASYSVPFMGMVLHGYVQYAGTPTNMASDSDYELLKMLENGANPYYMLSYQNLTKLKEAGAEYSKYYSVSFQIWLEDLIENYKKLNDELGSLQTATISYHSFLSGERIHTDEEEARYLDNVSVPNIMTDPDEIAAYKEARRDQYFAIDNSTVVSVEYSDGTAFIINYNDFDVVLFDENGELSDTVIEGYSYIRVSTK